METVDPSMAIGVETGGKIPSCEDRLFDAIASKQIDSVRQIVLENPSLNLNCLDKDELTPLQHACHIGNLELTTFLLDQGADVNFTSRKDGYTPLMFAAISSRASIVRLLLERGVDTKIENCVNRTAAQMAAFVGQTKIVAIINSWLPYEETVAPYTRCRELEEEPRIPSLELGRLLHSYIVYPSYHPVKLILFIKDNLDLIKYGPQFVYVLDNLSSKSLKPPLNEESLSLKYYFLSYLIEFCLKLVKTKVSGQETENDSSYLKICDKLIENLVRRLIRRENSSDVKPCTQQLDRFILESLLKYPYTQLGIFKTMTFALTKREPGDLTALTVLTQTMDGPRTFSQPAEACAVCGEMDKNKKCSRCKSIHYCSFSCQRADWFQHKRECRNLS